MTQDEAGKVRPILKRWVGGSQTEEGLRGHVSQLGAMQGVNLSFRNTSLQKLPYGR